MSASAFTLEPNSGFKLTEYGNSGSGLRLQGNLEDKDN